MPEILIVSQNEVFKQDLTDQISHHAPAFSVREEGDTPDIVVIDEDVSALEVWRKRKLKAPLIFIAPEADSQDTKADETITKPFYLGAFLDKIQAAITVFENSKEGRLSFNKYILYPSRKEILNLRNNEKTKLTEKEVAILKYLYKNKDKSVSKTDLMREVWEYAADATTHTVETHIYRLRQKVEKEDASAQLILTSEGGYQLIL